MLQVHAPIAPPRFARLLANVALATALAALALSCGEDEQPPPDGPSSDVPMPTGDPLTLTPATTGVTINFGDMPLMNGHSSLDIVAENFDVAVLDVQIIDERKALEFTPTDVKENPAKVQAKKRTEQLLDEIDDSLEASGVEDFADYVLVIDVFRINGSWLVRWDGVKIRDNEGEGAYGYSRDDMREESLEVIIAAVGEAAGRKNLTHVVVGAAIERLQLVNPEDFGNFVSFYADVYAAIKAEHPDVAVSPGLNWDRFSTEIAALYTPGGSVEEVTFAQIRAAWEEIAVPLFENADFFGLEASPNPELYSGDPSNLPDSQYALLAEVQGERPVVWYSVNWPVTSGAEKVTQREFLRRFVELNAGNDIDLMVWGAVRDFGPDICPRTTELGGPQSDCWAGVFSDSLASNKLSDEFVELIEK